MVVLIAGGAAVCFLAGDFFTDRAFGLVGDLLEGANALPTFETKEVLCHIL